MITKNTYIKKPGDRNFKRLYPRGKKRYDAVFKELTFNQVINIQKDFEKMRQPISVNYSNFGSTRTAITKAKNGTLVKSIIKQHY